MTGNASCNGSKVSMTVYMLTYCQSMESLYGSTLTFKTLRIGFPTAQVRVMDNHSVPEAAALIRREAEEVGCTYSYLKVPVSHHSWLGSLLLDPEVHGTVIILDPDMCFWQTCENWHFRKLLAGRLMPAFHNEFSECLDMPRIHTSFWWIHDAAAFRDRLIREYRKTSIGYLDPFVPYIFRHNGVRYKFDTGGNLYAAMQDDIYCFGERELECFDHLMVGTHLEIVRPWLNEKDQAYIQLLHDHAKNDHTKLKGLWKQQDFYCNVHAPRPAEDALCLPRAARNLEEATTSGPAAR